MLAFARPAPTEGFTLSHTTVAPTYHDSPLAFAKIQRDSLLTTISAPQPSRSQVHLRSLGGPVAQLSSWVRASQTKPVFFLLALSEDGRLEQMRIACKKSEPGLRRPDADDDVRVEHCKEWPLQDSVPHARFVGGVCSQFVVTKHHAYCVVVVRGQALLVKLGGQTNGTHEYMYTDRFPSCVTTMSMCPLDNNVIAFGVPPGEASSFAPSTAGGANAIEPLPSLLFGYGGGGASDSLRPRHVIVLVNFAQASRIQTLTTAHAQPLIVLEYSPDSEQLLSVSADCVQLWCGAHELADPVSTPPTERCAAAAAL